MKFQVIFPNSVEKDLKRIDKNIAKIICLTIQDKIATNPDRGKRLRGKREIYSWKARYKKTDYRIAYRINMGERLIYLLLIKSRENFYQELEKRLK